MTSQKKLTAEELRKVFATQSSKYKNDARIKRVSSVLRELSGAIKTMQDAGIDIAIEVRSGQYSNAYDLVFTNTENAKNSHISVYGFFNIAGSRHMWALADSINDTPVKKLYVSEFVASESQARIEWSSRQHTPGYRYDLDEDPDALAKMQLHLTNLACDRNFIHECDVASVFDRPAPASNQNKLPAKKGLKPSRP